MVMVYARNLEDARRCIKRQHDQIQALKNRHITRADIPEALVREIQAEALETHAVMMVREIDSMWLIDAAAKLREQKDET